VFENSNTLSLEVKDFEKLQMRDLKRWFGANNPGIHSPPNVHPCMPGVPERMKPVFCSMNY
jgi:hypothetical protein